MPVPTYDKFIEPVLRILASNQEGMSAPDVHNKAADVLGISVQDRLERLPSGQQLVYKNRAGWAHDRLKRAGLSSSPKHGFWRITPAGIEYAKVHAGPLPSSEISKLAVDFLGVMLKPQQGPGASELSSLTAAPGLAVSSAPGKTQAASPDDRLSLAVSELRESVTNEILELLANVSPTYFESVVLDVLHKIGYGTSRSDLVRVGGSGDGGIDGVISLDKLGLEKVYVQAKRWKSNVGSPEIQAFYGALAGQHASKGVFITTSGFTAQAIQFAQTVRGVVLVDGPHLAELMIDHEVGVTSIAVRVPKIDSDYFAED